MSHAQWSDEETGLVLPFAEGGATEQGFDGLEEALEATPFAEDEELQANPNIDRFLSGPTLRRGMSGIDVTMLQQGLIKLGHASPLNGKFDGDTEKAVKAFQRKAGLTPDGLVGRQTKLAMIKALGKSVPPIKPKRKGNTARGRLVVDQHPMIRSHRGGGPDLILRWNDIAQSGAVDVVFHFHGFSGHQLNMRLDRHKEAISGLDFADPEDNDTPGRSPPTLGVLPRGNAYGGKSGAGFSFPALTKPGAVRALVQDSLARASAATGHSLTLGRLILTGHSGGGAPIGAVIADVDPDEVQVFDGTYSSGKPIGDWAKRRIARELASPSAVPPALRVLFRAGSPTDREAREIASAICTALHSDAAAGLRSRFRVDSTRVGHNEIPATFGWRLLLDAGADLPDASTVPCVHRGVKRKKEAEEFESQEWEEENLNMAAQGYAPNDEDFDAQEDYVYGEDREELAWMDVEAEAEDEDEYLFEQESTYENSYENSYGESESDRFTDEGYLFEDYTDSEQYETGEGENDAAMEAFEQLLDSEDEGAGIIERIKGLAAFVLGPNLKRGSKGAAVETLQRCLQQLGYPIDVDGDFGPGTVRAVRAFQSREGLSVDGNCGPDTKKAIAAAINRAGKPAPAPAPLPAPVPAPFPNSALGDEIARVAKREWKRWHGATHYTELMPEATPILQEYYRVALGEEVKAEDLQNRKYQADRPWSAVFISYVMKTAGAKSFPFAGAHRIYVAKAYKNRLTNNTSSNFWTYRPEEVAPQVGDLICNWRTHPDTTLENINTKAGKKWRGTHCNIVVDVKPGVLTVIGGNVDQDVGQRQVYTLPDGRIDLNYVDPKSKKRKQQHYIGVVRCRGPIGSIAPMPTPPAPPPPAPAPRPAPVSGKKLTPTAFAAAFGPSARASEAKYGVPALVTLGQAALESGWGAKAGGFNFFGIKASESSPEQTRQLWKTREVMKTRDAKFYKILDGPTLRADGRYDYVVLAWFRKYPDAAASFDDHGALLVRNKAAYAKAFEYKHDPYAFAEQIARKYATDPSYADVLKKVMRMIEKVWAG